MDAVNWDEIHPIFSKLFDNFRNPKGLLCLLPLEGCIGENAEAALKTINGFSMEHGFKVSRSNSLSALIVSFHSFYY